MGESDKNKEDNESSKPVSYQFANFYYNCFNEKQFDDIAAIVKSDMVYDFQDQILNGKYDYMRYVQECMQRNARFHPETVDCMSRSGSKYKEIDIVVTGKVAINENVNNYWTVNMYKFTEYFSLVGDKNNNYWIQRGIFRVLS